MKYQVLFSLKTMKIYSRPSSAAVVIGALRFKAMSTRAICVDLG